MSTPTATSESKSKKSLKQDVYEQPDFYAIDDLLTEEHKLVRSSIRDFVKREIGKPKDQFHREFNGKVYSAEELSAVIIKKLRADAEKYLEQRVTDAVITVPAYFNDAERTATITAGQLAGLNVESAARPGLLHADVDAPQPRPFHPLKGQQIPTRIHHRNIHRLPDVLRLLLSRGDDSARIVQRDHVMLL